MDEELLEFYGKECPTCMELSKSLDKLEQDDGIQIKRYEVWHNASNLSIMLKYAEGRCSAVPFLYNKRTGEYFCGALVPYEKLVNWAKGL
ncbi:MAG: hypothetical protein JW825_06015 [Candidatus Methanofastidiosa archaeon]|nr:hypothetical protein [Candidatus Methanofastidiosa archaeon]